MASRPHFTRPAAALASGILFVLSGCSKGDGLSDYDRMKNAQKEAAESLTEKGAKLKETHFAQGSAWAVNLSGMEISDDLLRQVKQLGRVSELDLSRSTVTDDQLGLITQLGIATLVLKFDLSNTGITDAGLERLEHLAVLTQMNLAGTKVTPAGVERFKKQRKDDTTVQPFAKNPTIRLK